ncbi:hypothetical protein GCM10010387_62730 [Streptomyces inusitatus]|uniref:PPM-type phosphatase domain-containing protein n=1 Tax=Streptomyces inusitatus TaxID=68221 RepID=A0A918QM77_9ACTN|nr:protein phosphatase 2C domain-containing protein [Streptomyces inusitatus]GGZ60459.1 hypothetical protein GCM10010387_62730 [Streptomyces inusitatus]
MSQQAEDDWWDRLYEASATDGRGGPDGGRGIRKDEPAGPGGEPGDTLDSRFATASEAVAKAPGASPPARREPDPADLPAISGTPVAPPPGAGAERRAAGRAGLPDQGGPTAPDGVRPRPRAPWEPPLDPTPPAPAPEPAPAAEPVELPSAVSYPLFSGLGQPVPASPPPPPASPHPAAAAGHPGHVGDGPPTYRPEPDALPAATAENLGHLVPDTVLDGATYGSSTLRAASVRGDSARYRGETRREALLTARFGSGPAALVLVAVAAGERSAAGGHLAAADLCRRIGGAVARGHARLSDDIRAGRHGDLESGLRRLTDHGYGRLRAAAAERGMAPGAYTAGLRCLLLPADPGCRTRVFFGAGPGGFFRLRDGVWQDIEPAPPEPADEPGAPGRATGPEPFRFRAPVARPGDTLLLCGPGLADPLRSEPALAAELATRWAGPGEPPGLAGFLADAQLRVKGYADDRTAAAVWET